ncbi:hypothetical protein IWW48_000152 [Coemansia sp. RSA 1200]|nr:hypothetical protein IWW48_000152 [Coemansia sp. RSA 1200]
MVTADNLKSPSQPPFGGRYIALLRRTNSGMLFSDPVFVKESQALPDLPDGLQYVVIHPTAAQAKDRTMEDFMPADALKKSSHSTEHPLQQKSTILLPLEEDYGMFSSFLPSRDSSSSLFTHIDYNVLSTDYCVSEKSEPEAQVSKADLDYAFELAERILSDSSDNQSTPTISDLHGDIPQSVLEAIGFDQAAQMGKKQNKRYEPETESGAETAESILKENNALLTKLVELQDMRVRDNKFGEISNEELAVATKLQNSFARVVAASEPSTLRPPSMEIKRAADALLAKRQPVFSGVLPPQRRFAFVSNAISSTDFPHGATATPMQRQAVPAVRK